VPTYDYQCRSCGVVTEVIHSMREDGPSACEHCGGSLRRVLFPAGIIFKGSGFYRNDSRKPEATESSSSGSGTSTKKAASGSGATADASSSGSSSDTGKTSPATSEFSAS
jgi:putative FmdB family regulatory protein